MFSLAFRVFLDSAAFPRMKWAQRHASWRFKERSRAMDRWEDGQIDEQRAWLNPPLLVLNDLNLHWNSGTYTGGLVSMSPRLTFLMQDWGIERSAPLKCLVGVRREAVGLLKTVYDIDIKTQHIEWCQLKFHSVPFGKLGSWACQCEMNNETCLAHCLFNVELSFVEAPREWVCTSYRCRVKRQESSSFFIYAWNWAWRLNDYE